MGRFLHLPSPEEAPDEDPLSGVANIFDVAVVFIVGLMIALFSVYRLGDLLDPNSEVDKEFSSYAVKHGLNVEAAEELIELNDAANR
ncbi:MAG: DUF2149 domain-containing protein, partial [Planctomycetes bacterium]|nr:DUF2149 domain-containing protein [Planctomycetota bacterium]